MAYNNPIFNTGTVVYKDIDFSFLKNPMTDDLRTKTDEQSIIQSFKNLIYTQKGERPFDHTTGGGVWELLFEPLDEITKIQLNQSIASTISRYEPRVRILKLDVTEEDSTSLNIKITYAVLNSMQPQTVSFLLHRTR